MLVDCPIEIVPPQERLVTVQSQAFCLYIPLGQNLWCAFNADKVLPFKLTQLVFIAVIRLLNPSEIY
ncbi:hypothetical protein L3X38_045060 [Prunus dulcis]|uniref:Uncharacterized protein n=1 Tax=Prunus dulcis TaxID=3755 RepID=A0AAD4UZU3_PRUDU|nr:hypothetical protein L3X38_045060 [Prunus dulcis]